MATPKTFFHDHLVLALLSANAFLTLASSIFVLVRLGTSHGNSYFVQYRPDLGINAFKTGSIVELLSFILFAFLVMAVHTMMSLRMYKINRQLAIMILSLGLLLLVLNIIISNALLLLR